MLKVDQSQMLLSAARPMLDEGEILAVVSWLNLGTWLLAAGQSLALPLAAPFWLKLTVELVVLLPLQALLYLKPRLASFIIPAGASACIVLTVLLHVKRHRQDQGAANAQVKASSSLPTPVSMGSVDVYSEVPRKPFFTNVRATIMILCTLGVIMAGTAGFPQHFLKRHDYSASLMDVGTGCIVTTFGMTFGRYFLDSSVPCYRSDARPIRPTLAGTLRMTGILAVIGLVRYAAIAVGMPSEGAEYGIHWNFFFTLAALPLPVYIIMKWVPAVLALPLGLVIAAIHQIVLSTAGVGQFALSASKEYQTVKPMDVAGFAPKAFLKLNRRGIVSLPGYVALQLVAMGIAQEVFTRKTAQQHRVLLVKWLGVIATFTAAYALLNSVFHISPSRTIANAPYILYVSTIVTISGAVHLFVDLFVTLPDTPTAPVLMEAVNYNQLLFFLAVNLATGVLNWLNRDILHRQSQTWIVTLAIMTACSLAVVGLHKMQWCLRL